MKLFLRALVVLLPLLATPAYAQDIDKGLRAYHLGDFATALREWRPLAESGSAEAEYNLGILYEKGQGVPQDFVEAVKWYRKAVAQGYAAAQTNLGSLYWYGRGVPQDFAEAGRWYREAAEQGDAQARFNLGTMYENGVEVPQDFAEAVRWYRKAAAQGHDGAKKRLVSVLEIPAREEVASPPNPPGEDLQADDPRPSTLTEQNFEKGLSAARAGNYAAAYLEWLPLAEGDHVEAQFNIGALNEGGHGIRKSAVAAASWYSRAAGRGHAKAQYNLAIMFLEGRGVTRNETRAADLLRKAAEQKHAKAQYNLAVLYRSGRGVRKDLQLAHSWFDRARANGIKVPGTATASAPSQSRLNSTNTGSPKTQAGASNNWRTICENGGCRTYVTSKFPYNNPDYQKYYLPVLEFTPTNEIRFAGLYARELHNQIYTTNIPTELIHNKEEYVTTTYFSTKSDVIYGLYVDGNKLANLNQIDSGHLWVKVSNGILTAFRKGTEVEIKPSINGYFTYTFSLAGFTSAYRARTNTQQARSP